MTTQMKQRIASTFEAMTRSKEIDKITVKNLVEECGISRQTFYYHFRDILDVMEWSLREMIRHAAEYAQKAATPQKALEELIRVSMLHQDFLIRLFLSQRRGQASYVFVDAMRSGIEQLLREKRPDLSLNRQDLDVALNFYAYGMAGAIFENCTHDTMDAETLAHRLYLLISGEILP